MAQSPPLRHMRFQLDLWMDPDQEGTYRADRDVSPDDDVRPDVATYLHEEILGAGTLAGWWESEIRTR